MKMTVLSDATLNARFKSLIVGGNPQRARGCSYSFLPGKLFPTGVDDNGQGRTVVDWTSGNNPTHTQHAVRPGELILLRTLETVTMPTDCCGLWYQTDKLSR